MPEDQSHHNGSQTLLPRVLYGIGGSAGIAIGRAMVLESGRSGRTHLRRERLRPEDRDAEKKRFRLAVEQAVEELVQSRKDFVGQLEEYAPIIDSHLLMLKDRMLYDRTLETIETEGMNAEWALETALHHARDAFQRIGDPYIRDRYHDVEQVAGRIFRLLSGSTGNPLAGVEGQVIVVARDFSPEDTIRMRSDHILGFLTEIGGATSHTAIVARTLGIPSVLGVENVTREVQTGDLLVIEGHAGRIHLHPTPDQLQQFQELQHQFEQYNSAVASFAHLPAVTRDGLQVRIDANIEMVEEVGTALEYGAGGIGLFRSEYYYISAGTIPDEEALYDIYRQLLSSMAPFPVTIRTLDIGGDKFASAVSWGGETNPAMGLRAIRFSLREREIFKAQLRALLRASVHGKLRILFPLISSLTEVDLVKEILLRVQEEMRAQGLSFAEPLPIGIMVEVPSAVVLADVLACTVDFFSIGTNDLIQYALAIDRVNEHVAHMYEPLHPAVLRMIKQVVEAGHAAGIEVSLCGEMAGDLACVPLLLGLGLDELSMHPLAIPYVKRLVRNSTSSQVENLSRELLSFTSAKAIRGYLAEHLPRLYPEEFGEGSLRQRVQRWRREG